MKIKKRKRRDKNNKDRITVSTMEETKLDPKLTELSTKPSELHTELSTKPTELHTAKDAMLSTTGITINGIPLQETVQVMEGAEIYKSLKAPVYVYRKPVIHKPITRQATSSKRSAPVKQYTRGEINQNYGKQAAIEACTSGKSVMWVCLNLLLAGGPVRTKDINDIYLACKRKIAGPSITGTMKRLEKTDLAPLLRTNKERGYHTWTLIKEATGIRFDDMRSLVNRMNKYDKDSLLMDYPELEEFYNVSSVEVSQIEAMDAASRIEAMDAEAANNTSKTAKIVQDTAKIAQDTDYTNVSEEPKATIKSILSTILGQAVSTDNTKTTPLRFHFSFDFNINVNLSLKD